MTSARIELCAGCGEALTAARLHVNDPKGPSGTFHTGHRCYLDAVDRHRAALAGPPVDGDALGGVGGAKAAIANPGANLPIYGGRL